MMCYLLMIGWLTTCFRGMWENPARCGKSGGRAKNQFQGTSVCYPGNLGAEVEMEYNCVFSLACNGIQSQKAEKVCAMHRWLESPGNLDRADVVTRIITLRLPSQHPTCRYELPDLQMYSHGSCIRQIKATDKLYTAWCTDKSYIELLLSHGLTLTDAQM